MHVDYILVFVSMVTFPRVCNTASDKSLDEFEKRIDDLRAHLNQKAVGSDALVNEHNDRTQRPAERSDMGDYPDKIKELINRLSHKTERCCIMGKILAELGLHCNNFRFSKASQRIKLRLVNDTLVQLGIQVNRNNRHTLYIPFRVCALRNPRELDKCCLRHENEKPGCNEMNLGISGKHGSGSHRRRDKKQNHHHSLESAKRDFENVRRPPRGNPTRRHGSLDRNNYQWERWTEYRALRAKHQHHHKASTRHISYRRRRQH